MRLHLIPALLLATTVVASAPTRADYQMSVTLNGAQERPTPVATSGTGLGSVFLSEADRTLTINLSSRNLTSDITGAHIHLVAPGTPDPTNAVGPIVFDILARSGLTAPLVGSASSFAFPTTVFNNLTSGQIAAFFEGRAYFNIHTQNFRAGEIRGNLAAVPEPSSLVLSATGATGLLILARRRRGASAS